MSIPLFQIDWTEQDIQSVNESIRRGTQWAEGPCIDEFEAALIGYLGCQGALVCNSGTAALHMALIASGVCYFHEVIVPSFTFIATANAVKMLGAKVIFADIEEQSFGLDPEDVKRKITPRTKAIIAVHYAGIPCRIKELQKIAFDNNLILIEDVAEAMGAEVDGVKLGDFGDCAAFSFCQNKIISTGEGGALITSNKTIYDKARLLRSHGGVNHYYVTLGYNYRMPDMLAALGKSQLARIDELIKRRRAIAKQYTVELGIPFYADSVYQMMPMRFKERDKTMKMLQDKGISCTSKWFQPVHLTDYYRKFINARLPVTERISREILSLPMYTGLTEKEVDFICQAIKS